MRTLPPHTAPTRVLCVSDLRIQLLLAVCVGMVHMIFSGSSKSTHTAHNEISKLTYIQFMFSIYAPCCVHKSFRTHVIIPIYGVRSWFYQWYTSIVQGSTSVTIGNTIGKNISNTIGKTRWLPILQTMTLFGVSQWYHWSFSQWYQW